MPGVSWNPLVHRAAHGSMSESHACLWLRKTDLTPIFFLQTLVAVKGEGISVARLLSSPTTAFAWSEDVSKKTENNYLRHSPPNYLQEASRPINDNMALHQIRDECQATRRPQSQPQSPRQCYRPHRRRSRGRLVLMLLPSSFKPHLHLHPLDLPYSQLL